MTTKKKSTDQIYDDNAEASRAHGLRPKGTAKPPPKGKVVVQHKREGLGLSMLAKTQLLYISTTAVIGEFMIYDTLIEPYRAHAMWAFGLATIVALVPCFLRKRE